MSGTELFAANRATTTVSSGGTSAPAAGTTETWTVASSAMFGAAGTGVSQFHVADQAAPTEIIAVTNVSGTTWTVTRGAESTTPVAHSAGFTVYQVATAGYLTSVLAGVLSPSGDATGVTDTANVNAAITAIGSGCGRILLAAGTFYWTCGSVVVTNPGVYIQGAGRWATIISAVGTGDTFRAYTTGSYSAGGPAGGCLKGLTFDGTNAGAGSSGFHVGDLYNYEFNAGVRNFTGTGSKGAWLDNNYHWAEQATGKIWAEQCTSCVVFDNSANTSGVATGSFDRAVLDIFLDCKDKGSGVVFQNGAFMVDHDLGIFGNMDSSALAGAPFAAVTITGQNSNNFSYLANGTLRWGVELNGNTHTLPASVRYGTVGPNGNYIQNCTGLIDFAGNNAFAAPVNAGSNFQFDGPVFGPGGTLGRSVGVGQDPYQYGALSNGNQVITRYNSVTRVTTSGNVTGITLSGFNPNSGQVFWLVNDGTGTITFAAQGTSKVMGGTLVSVAANSAAQFIWNTNEAAWFPASGVTVSTAASDVQPDGVQSAGVSGKAPAADHVHQNNADLSLYLAPSGATGETYPRTSANGYTTALTSGTTFLSAIPLPAGLVVGNLGVMTGSTAPSGVTHGWLALADSSRIVRAVTADQTSTFGSGFTALSLPAASTYTTPTAGLYYMAGCCVASTMGTLSIGSQPLSGPNSTAPILSGSSSTAQTTPPAVGSTLATITAGGTWRFYGYTS